MNPNILNITLWVAQGLLSASLLYGAFVKIIQPISKIASMWKWAGEISPMLVRLTGWIDLVGSLGLVLPMLLNAAPHLVFWAAVGTAALMACAALFHISRGETRQIIPNILFMALAIFVAWGRHGL
jgi:hypothetical protein